MVKSKLLVASVVCSLGAAIYFSTGYAENASTASPEDERGTKVQHDELEDLKPEDHLTVEQTLGLIFTRYVDTPVIHLYRHANPDAKQALYRVLENEQLEEFHEDVWTVLGYIGDELDLKRLEKSLWNDFEGVLQGVERHVVPSMFKAVGLMVARDIEGAQELANKMMTPDYWEDAPFRWHVEGPPKQPDFVYYTLYRFMLGYSLSLDPNMREKVQKIRERIGEVDERKLGEYFTRDSFFNPETLTKGLLTNGRNNRATEDRPVTNEERREVLAHFNGDLQNPGPARPPRDPDKISLDADAEDARSRPPQTPEEKLRQIAYRFSVDAEGNLDTIHFHGEQVTNDTLQLLDAVPQLRSLSLVSTAVTDEGLAHLQQTEQLKRLAISRTRKITDQGLQHVADVQTLTELLLLYMPNITDEGLEYLKGFQNVEYLNLTQINITDAALKHMQHFENLKKLHIIDARITGNGLQHIAALKNINALLLRGVPFTNEGLRELHKFQHLKKISLGRTTSTSYQPQYSAEALEQLRQALPETEITHVGQVPE